MNCAILDLKNYPAFQPDARLLPKALERSKTFARHPEIITPSGILAVNLQVER